MALAGDAGTERLRDLPNEFYVPVGYELVDEKFLNQKWQELLAQEKGETALAQKLFTAFLTEFQGLEAVDTVEPSRLTVVMRKSSQALADLTMSTVTVGKLFEETFTSEQAQKNQLSLIINESDGRIRTPGEIDSMIPKNKFILAPDTSTGERMVRLANEINSKGGEWISIVVLGGNKISFCQYRCGVSLTYQMEEDLKHFDLPKDPRELVELGARPLISLAPVQNASSQEIDQILAQGVLTGQIHAAPQGYFLNGDPENVIPLGTDYAKVHKVLDRDYQLPLRIYRKFMLAIGENSHAIYQQIDRLANKNIGKEDILFEEIRQVLEPVRQLAQAAELYARQAVMAAKLRKNESI